MSRGSTCERDGPRIRELPRDLPLIREAVAAHGLKVSVLPLPRADAGADPDHIDAQRVIIVNSSHLIQLPTSPVAEPVKTRRCPSMYQCLARHRSTKTSANG